MISRRPYKRFSQNFLHNQAIAFRTVQALEIHGEDVVIEIGAGKGVLTDHIVKAQPRQLIIVEIDRRWFAHLQERFSKNAAIVNDDFMEMELEPVFNRYNRRLKVIGNIPYHITSPILFKLIDCYHLIENVVIMIQKEVARRIVAEPGTKEYGILSVICQTYTEPEYQFSVAAGNFFPKPEVDSAVLRFRFRNQIENVDNPALFRHLVRHVFNYRRKMLRNSLSRIFDKSIVYSLTSISINARPEELSVDQLKILSNEINLKTREPDAAD